jgi:hypothetical protein
MLYEWVPQSPDDLRRQAQTLRKLAAHVSRRDVAGHLEEQAAELLAKAELRSLSVRGFKACF